MTRWLSVVVLLAMVCTAVADETPNAGDAPYAENPDIDMTSSLNKVSYAMGYKIGDMFQNLKLSVAPAAVVKGMYDARKNIKPAMTKAKMKIILRDPKKFMLEDIDSISQKNKKEGTLFLGANAQRPDVVVRDSGLQYVVLREGTGKSPQNTDIVKIHYKGRNLKGHVFDDTYAKGEPAEFGVISVLPGMNEALQLMKEGAKWEIYVPNNLAYANHGPMAGLTLIFEIELIEVMPSKQ
jgi:FKBP-type peptidyl-prolyl cis-trans isomerase FklB